MRPKRNGVTSGKFCVLSLVSGTARFDDQSGNNGIAGDDGWKIQSLPSILYIEHPLHEVARSARGCLLLLTR